MRIANLDPELEHRVPFELRSNAKVQTRSGYYVITNIYGDVLYIGITSDLRRRMDDHLRNSRMTQRTSLGLASWFCFRYLCDEDLHEIERHLLSRHKFSDGKLPPLNRVGP